MITLAIELLHLRHTIKEFFVVFTAQNAKYEVPKLVTTEEHPTCRAPSDKPRSGKSVACPWYLAPCAAVTPTFPALHIFFKIGQWVTYIAHNPLHRTLHGPLSHSDFHGLVKSQNLTFQSLKQEKKNKFESTNTLLLNTIHIRLSQLG